MRRRLVGRHRQFQFGAVAQQLPTLKELPISSRFNECPTASDCFRLTGFQPASQDHAIAVTQQGRK